MQKRPTTPGVWRVCSIALALLGSFPGHAARPLITDDARVLDQGTCQIESWVQRNRDSTEYWALPACNFTGNLDLTFGGARTREGDRTYTSEIQGQGKLLIRALSTNSVGVVVVAGTVRHLQPDARDWFLYVPISASLLDDRVVIHANLGGVREGETGQRRASWAAGSETRVSERMVVIAEVFGQDRGRASYQVGVRYTVIPDHLQIDATYGSKAGERPGDRWFSVGLQLVTPPFLGSFGR